MSKTGVGPFPFEGREEFGGCLCNRTGRRNSSLEGLPGFMPAFPDAEIEFGDFGSDAVTHDPNDDAHNYWVDATNPDKSVVDLGDGAVVDEEEADGDECLDSLRAQLLEWDETVISPDATVADRPMDSWERELLIELFGGEDDAEKELAALDIVRDETAALVAKFAKKKKRPCRVKPRAALAVPPKEGVVEAYVVKFLDGANWKYASRPVSVSVRRTSPRCVQAMSRAAVDRKAVLKARHAA